ncbi:MAG: nucleotidyltransferase domain-containing protein [Acidobacteria bacterium]|nr:nucleotidyltransferase domain-containing protein [Acidobacteriota bacterium]
MDPDLVARITGRHGIRLLLQFGSTVTGHEHPHSDVDLAVEFAEVPGSFATLGEAMADLQSLFPGREVDVAVVNRADPLFLDRILRSCRLLHGDPRRLNELRMYAFKRYQDHKRFLAMEREYVARVLARAGAS